jgi:hypothetical protein
VDLRALIQRGFPDSGMPPGNSMPWPHISAN